MTAEQKVSQAALQEPSTVTIGGKEYKVAPPSTGTIIKVSDIISQYPEFEIPEKLSEALAVAKDYAFTPDVLAALILGSREVGKPATEMKIVTEYRLGFIPIKKEREVEIAGVTKFDQLRDILTHDVPPSEVLTATVELLHNRAETGFFFQNITFLRGRSMTAPTKTTASGQ